MSLVAVNDPKARGRRGGMLVLFVPCGRSPLSAEEVLCVPRGTSTSSVDSNGAADMRLKLSVPIRPPRRLHLPFVSRSSPLNVAPPFV